MKLLGAIYVYNKQVVSLYKGDFTQMSTYRETPLEIAKRYQKAGLSEVHFVDFNASNKLDLVNEEALDQVIKLGLSVQYAGGVRSMECVDKLFAKGVRQVVIGVSGADIIPEALQKYGEEKIIHGIKAKYDKLATEEKGISNVIDYAESLRESKIKYLLFKDILSSGVMIHPNYDMVEKIGILSGKKVYVAGGISQAKHLTILKNAKAYGAIIGKAFYEKQLRIYDALKET